MGCTPRSIRTIATGSRSPASRPSRSHQGNGRARWPTVAQAVPFPQPWNRQPSGEHEKIEHSEEIPVGDPVPRERYVGIRGAADVEVDVKPLQKGPRLLGLGRVVHIEDWLRRRVWPAHPCPPICLSLGRRWRPFPCRYFYVAGLTPTKRHSPCRLGRGCVSSDGAWRLRPSTCPRAAWAAPPRTSPRASR